MNQFRSTYFYHSTPSGEFQYQNFRRIEFPALEICTVMGNSFRFRREFQFHSGNISSEIGKCFDSSVPEFDRNRPVDTNYGHSLQGNMLCSQCDKSVLYLRKNKGIGFNRTFTISFPLCSIYADISFPIRYYRVVRVIPLIKCAQPCGICRRSKGLGTLVTNTKPQQWRI